MVQARAADEWALSLSLQGRIGTYPPAAGQEANTVGAIMAVRPDDWFLQTHRELGGLLARGVPLQYFYLYWLGNEEGCALDPGRYYVTPVSIPVGSHLPHAVGLAFAEHYLGSDRIAIVFVGDGGTSIGDFHEALNLAAVWKAGTIFFVQNNQYALSVPRNEQTATPTLAEKASAYGLEGVQIDGNDVAAVYEATATAAAKARAGDGPTLIEGITYRLGPHTTPDDPTRYRSPEEVEQWKSRDPIIRLQKLLLTRRLMDEAAFAEIAADARRMARSEFEAVERLPRPTLDDTFHHVYADLPQQFHQQLAARRRALQRTGK